MRHNPHIDEVIVAERPRGMRAARATTARSRGGCARARFDVVIDFHGGPRSAWLTWATGAPQRIGYACRGARWVYTDRCRGRRSLVPPRHSVQNQWDLLAPLGIAARRPGRATGRDGRGRRGRGRASRSGCREPA